MQRLILSLRIFAADMRGNMSVEAIFVLPILTWAFITFTVFWDAFRANNLAQKATYVIADIVSRERSQVQNYYMTNYFRTFVYAAERPERTVSNSQVMLRVTSVLFSEGSVDEEDHTTTGDDSVAVLWSMTSNSTAYPAHTNTSITALLPRIPAMLNGDSMIIVESRVTWQPDFTAQFAGSVLSDVEGLGTRVMNNLTSVRPRFVPKVCHALVDGNYCSL